MAGAAAASGLGDTEVIRALYELFNQRDEEGVLALYSPTAEVHSFVAAVDGEQVFSGMDGVREWYRNLVGTLGMTIEAGGMLAYRRYVLSIPLITVNIGGQANQYEQGIVYELAGGRIQRSFGYGKVGTAMSKLANLLLGEHELAV